MASGQRIVVVGAGIVGASIAWHLAKAGAEVEILDGGSEPGGVATRASFAWINASWGNTQPYYRLRRAAMSAWRALDGQVDGLSVDWCGGLVWDLAPDDLEAFAVEHGAWGYPLRRLDAAEVAELEPAVVAPDLAVLCPDEGVVDPVAATAAFVDGARRRGARLRPATPIAGLILRGERIVGVETAAGPVQADHVVLAAGTATTGLIARFGLSMPLRRAPGLLVWSQPLPPLVRRALIAPGLEIRQLADGALLIAGDLLDGDGDGTASATFRMELAQALLRTPEPLVVARHVIGWRPVPADGFPVIGRPAAIDGLSVAVTHSGVTLAPIIGIGLATDLSGAPRDPLFAPYGFDRAMTSARHSGP